MRMSQLCSLVALATVFAVPAVCRGDSAPGGTVGSRLGFNAGVIDWNQPDRAQVIADVEAVMAGIEASGSKWVRFDLAWWDIQPSNTQWNWDNADLMVDKAVAHHLNIIGVPYSAPCWAAGQPSNCNPWDIHYVGTTASLYQDFVTQVGLRYLNRIATWELWNEPNNPGFYSSNPNPQEYVQRVLIPGATALRNARTWLTATTGVTYPLRILTGGTAPSPTGFDDNGKNTYSPADFLGGIYQYGGQPYFDAVAHHPYSFPFPPETPGSWNAFTQSDDLHALMDTHGDGTKEIWATEIGFPTQIGAASPTGSCPATDGSPAVDKCVDETTQAALYDLAMRAWIDRSYTGPMIWFTYRDGATGVPGEGQYGWGVVKSDWSFKPARLTLQLEAAYPVVSLGPFASIVEGNSGNRALSSTLSVSKPYASAVTVACQTLNGSAVAPTDFATKTADVSIGQNTTSDFFAVTVKGDTTAESDEAYIVSCDAKNATATCNEVAVNSQRSVQSCAWPTTFPVAPIMRQTAAYAFVLNDEPAGSNTEVSIGDAWIVEGDANHNTNKRNLYFTVSASKVHKDAAGVSQPIGLTVTVTGGSGAGQATLGSDFLAPAATETIAKGGTVAKVTVPILGDAVRESDESFTVTISNPTNGAVIRRGSATGMILNDDY